MKKKFLFTLSLVLAGIMLIQPSVFGGAWTTPKNHLWFEIYNKYAFANDYFNSDGDQIPLGYDYANDIDKGAEWWAYDFEVKTEYGLADWMNLLVGVSYERAKYKEHARPTSWGPYSVDSSGIKYVTVGGKFRAIEAPLVVSFQVLGYISNFDLKKTNPLIGKNDSKLELKILLGKSYKLGRMPAYSGFETGYRFRGFDEVADDIPLFFETGVVLTDHFMMTGEIDTWLSKDRGGRDRESSMTVRGGLIFSPSGQFNQFRKGTNHFNIAVQGGSKVWGLNTNASWEVIVKFSAQFDIPGFVDSIGTENHENTREISHS